MTIKERIHAEIDSVEEESLTELFRLVKRFVAKKKPHKNHGIMAKLRKVKIEAPADFAANLDLYINGEKRVEDNLP